uniref:Mitochondrial trans-2-enoyl-CoA reductase n=1 Tax=Tetraselmis sp. GSL018 TaxID=582737 RepID=A0A061RIL2_9CHLO
MEGVGVVKALGAEVRASDLAPGDRVVPLDPMLGTWRSLAALPAASLYRIPECLPELPAACLTINPPTALCLLERFVDLEEGSVIVQNGANSAIGKAVVEVAASRGIKTLNIVRDRPNWDDVAERLTAIGATAVIRPEEAKAAGAGWKPALGLDCVGGESATAIAKLLRPGGTMVTYGAMSLKPISISAPLLIFKDLRIRGFALSKESTPDLKAKLLDRVITLAQKGLFASSRFEEFALEDYQEALQFCERGFRDSKAILRISH